jgi:hypothetical protein
MPSVSAKSDIKTKKSPTAVISAGKSDDQLKSISNGNGTSRDCISLVRKLSYDQAASNANNQAFAKVDSSHLNYKMPSCFLNKNKLISLFQPLAQMYAGNLVVFVLVLAVVFYAAMHLSSSGENRTAQQSSSPLEQHNKAVLRKEQFLKFTALIQDLKKQYPNQTRSFWANIESSFRHSILDSKDPSIVLLVNDRPNKHLTKRLTMDLLSGLVSCVRTNAKTNINNFIIDPKADAKLSNLINGRDYGGAKLHVDQKLDAIFRLSDQRIALVNNIEMLPAHTMLLFYTYGDDLDNAKYPGVLILMSLELNEELSDEQRGRFLASPKSVTKFAEDHMFDLWSRYVGEDQLRPLFTRIANNVVFVNSE